MEPQLLEVGREARLVQVVGDHLGAWGEARLHPRLRLEAALDGLLRDEPGRDHHRRIRCVGAARDRKSTRLNSSHSQISYAVFCLKKKKKQHDHLTRVYAP